VEAVIGLLKTHRTVEEQRQLFAAANSVFLVTSALSVLLALILFVAFLGREDSSFVTITCVLVSGWLLSYSLLQAQIVRLEEKHLSSLCFNFVIPFSGLIGSFLVFALERTVQSFFLGSAIGLAISLVGARIKVVGFYFLADAIVKWRPILLRIAPFIAVIFLGWLGGYGNNFIIKLFFDSAEVAKFTFVFTLSAIMQLVATATNQVWSPRFYRLIHDLPLDQVERQNRRFFRLQGIALGFTGGILIALYPSAMNVLGGNLTYYQSFSFELALLVLSYVILTPWWQCQNYFLAYDKGPSVLRIHAATSAIGIVALVMCMLLLGPLGIYIGFLVQMGLRSAVGLLVARRHWPVNISLGGIVAGVLITFIGFAVSGIELGN